MSAFAELLLDQKVHDCAPSAYAGSANADLWVPGVYVWVARDGLRLAAVFPRPDGDVEGFELREDNDRVFLQVPTGMRPASCVVEAVQPGELLELTEFPQQLRALCGHIIALAQMCPNRRRSYVKA